jgi:hypothetical protein
MLGIVGVLMLPAPGRHPSAPFVIGKQGTGNHENGNGSEE